MTRRIRCKPKILLVTTADKDLRKDAKRPHLNAGQGDKKGLSHPHTSTCAHMIPAFPMIRSKPIPHLFSPRLPPGSTRVTLAHRVLGDCVHRVSIVASTYFIRVTVTRVVADALAVDRVVGVGGGIRRDVAAPALGTPPRGIVRSSFRCGMSRSRSKYFQYDVLRHRKQVVEPPWLSMNGDGQPIAKYYSDTTQTCSSQAGLQLFSQRKSQPSKRRVYQNVGGPTGCREERIARFPQEASRTTNDTGNSVREPRTHSCHSELVFLTSNEYWVPKNALSAQSPAQICRSTTFEYNHWTERSGRGHRERGRNACSRAESGDKGATCGTRQKNDRRTSRMLDRGVVLVKFGTLPTTASIENDVRPTRTPPGMSVSV